jgi:hypothetical protein
LILVVLQLEKLHPLQQEHLSKLESIVVLVVAVPLERLGLGGGVTALVAVGSELESSSSRAVAAA